MSFILDALKKSEHKRRFQDDQEPRTIFDPSVNKAPGPRIWLILLVFFLVLNLVLLAWLVTFWWRSPSSAMVEEDSPPVAVLPVNRPEPDPLPGPRLSTEEHQAPAVALPESPAKVSSTSPAAAPPLTMTPAEDDRLYLLSELPAAVRGRVPQLQLALHAFNAGDAASSLVQINGRAVRAGVQIGDNLTLEEITAEGAIMRFDRYRFLLPRRGQ